MSTTRLSLSFATLTLACVACSGSQSVVESDELSDSARDFRLPRVANQQLEPLIKLYGSDVAYLRIVELTALEDPVALEAIPDDMWSDCQASIVDAPPELGEHVDLSPPTENVWLVYEGGACAADLEPPVLLIGHSGFLCEVILAFPVSEVAADCAGGASRGAPAPYVVVAAEVAPDLRWVPVTEPELELETDGASGAQLSFQGVTTDVTPEPDWDAEYLAEWFERLGQPNVHLSVDAHLTRVETPLEAVELRSVSWFFMSGGSDPTLADCNCVNWETGERIPGCIDDHYETYRNDMGLINDGRFLALDTAANYPRGALVEGGRMGVLVTGYLTGVSAHRRTHALTFDPADLVFVVPSHEEDSELPPIMQAPYCGP